MSFRGRPVILEGSLNNQGVFEAEFLSEWLDVVEDYVFQLKLRSRNEAAKDAAG